MLQMPTTAVLLAAGRGRRLRPHTDQTPKPLLAVHGRPTLDFILEAVVVAGIQRVCIVTHYLSEQIADYVGDGSAWGLTITCCRQPELDGTATALQAAVHARPEWFVAGQSFLLSATDYLFPRHYLADLTAAYRAMHTDAVVSLKRVPQEELSRRSAVIMDPDGRIRQIVEKPKQWAKLAPLSGSLIFVLPTAIVDFLPRMEPSERGEYEIQSIINMMLADGYTASGLVQVAPEEWHEGLL